MHQSAHVFRTVIFEAFDRRMEPEARFMPRFLRPDAVCLHIGASDGRHGFVMARAAPQGQVHCIEPSRYSLGVLNTLRRLKGLRNLQTHHLAIGEDEGEAYLVTPLKSSGRPARRSAYLAAMPPEPGERALADPVPVQSIDAFCQANGVNKVDFVRFDVEGAEVQVLSGGAGRLVDDRPVVMLELHPAFIAERFGRSADDIAAWCSEHCYGILHMEGGDLARIDRFATGGLRDYFLVPQERMAEAGVPA